MRTHLNIIDGKGVTKKMALFGSKSDFGVRVVGENRAVRRPYSP